MFSSNQVRQVLVATTISNSATIDTFAEFKTAAVANSLYLGAGDGNVYTTVQKNIAFKTINSDGLVISSDVIDTDKITYLKVLGYSAPVLKVATIDPGTAVNNGVYELRVIFKNWGSLSAENSYVRSAMFKADASATKEEIIDGLILALADNLSKEEPSTGATESVTLFAGATTVPSNPYFTFSITDTGVDSTARLVITEKAQSYVTGKKQNRQLLWEAVVLEPTNDSAVTYNAPTKGIGAGKDVKDLEWFAKGFRADMYRGMGYPNNFEESYVATTSGTYNILEIGYYYSGSAENVQRVPKTLTVCVPASTAAAFAQYIIGPLATMTGKNIGAPTTGFGAAIAIAADGGADSTVTFYPATAIYSVLSAPAWAPSSFSTNTLTINPAANTGGPAREGFVIVGTNFTTYTIKVTQAVA